MGSSSSIVGPKYLKNSSMSRRESLVETSRNHTSQEPYNAVKVHALITESFDINGIGGDVPLRLATDQEILAEIARRKLDIVSSMTDAFVCETYTINESIGSGSSAEVSLAVHKVTKEKYACKKIRKDAIINDLQSMINEVEILKRLRHRHVIAANEIYESSKCVWIILELVTGGNLLDHIISCKIFTEATAARLMYQLLIAVQYIHSQGVVHRDLKADNVLVQQKDGKYDVKVTDFGLSALCGVNCIGGFDGEDGIKRKRFKELSDRWGTRQYLAPEVLDGAYGPQVDLWAVGCIAFEVLSGDESFPAVRDGGMTEDGYPEDHEMSDLFARILRAEYNINSIGWGYVSDSGKEFVKGLLQIDPVKRWNSTEALQDSWITGSSHTEEQRIHLAYGPHATQKRRRRTMNNIPL
jgi:serine/threonine protein kinase